MLKDFNSLVGDRLFGYVKPFLPELRVKEKDLYNAFYCGLCRSMKKHTGALSPLALSYDCTFLAIVRAAQAAERITASRIRCGAHPAKKRAAVDDSPSLTYAAYVSALLTYYKLSDDKADEAGLKKLRAAVLAPFASGMKKRTSLGELEAKVKDSLGKLASLEAAKSDSIDETAGTFGSLLAAVFEYGIDGSDARILHEFGYHIGKYVYIADAADDAADDEKSGSYNPIITAYGTAALENREITVGEKKMTKRLLSETVASDIMRACLLELNEADKAISLLDMSRTPALAAIIENTVRLGMPKELDRILAGLPQQSFTPHTEI